MERNGIMARKRFSDEDVIRLLRQIKVETASGASVVEACQSAGVSAATYYVWQKKYGGMGPSKFKEMKALEVENQRLRKTVSDLTLDKRILQESLRAQGLTVASLRQTVIHCCQKLGTSERRTCQVLGLSRGNFRYPSVPKDKGDALPLTPIERAKRYGRSGYRKIAALFRTGR